MEGYIERNDGKLHPRVDESAPPAGLTAEDWRVLCEDDSIESLVKMSRALGVPDDETRSLGAAIFSDEAREELFALLDDDPSTRAS